MFRMRDEVGFHVNETIKMLQIILSELNYRKKKNINLIKLIS